MNDRSPRILQPRPAFLVFFALIVLAFSLVVVRRMLAPVVLAIVVAVVLHPLHRRLESRLGVSSLRSALASLGLFTAFVGAPVMAAAFLFVAQVGAVLEDLVGLPEGSGLTTGLARLVDQYLVWMEEVGSRYLQEAIDLRTIASDWVDELAAGFYSSLPSLLGWLGWLVIAYLVFNVTLFFLLRDGRRLGALLRDISPLDRRYAAQILGRLEVTIRAVFVGGVFTALYQATVGSLGFLVVGFASFVIWGVFLFVASFLPVVGSALVWGPAVLYLALTGEGTKALILLGFGIFISTTDNLLRILLIGRQTTLHPLLVFLAVFGGLATGGAMGLVYGLLLAATLAEAVAIYRDEFGRGAAGASSVGSDQPSERAT